MTTPRKTARTDRSRLHAIEAGDQVRVAVYLRISTDEEHQPFSLEAQEHRLRAFIESQPGWTLARPPYVDQMSGAKMERPALQKALRDAALGLYDVLLVYRVDRFARKLSVLVELLEQLDQSGVAFRSATEPIDTSSATGRMLVQLLGVFAEFERETIIDRVIAGMERRPPLDRHRRRRPDAVDLSQGRRGLRPRDGGGHHQDQGRPSHHHPAPQGGQRV